MARSQRTEDGARAHWELFQEARRMAESRDIGPGPQHEQDHAVQVCVALFQVQIPKQCLLVEDSRLRLEPRCVWTDR